MSNHAGSLNGDASDVTKMCHTSFIKIHLSLAVTSNLHRKFFIRGWRDRLRNTTLQHPDGISGCVGCDINRNPSLRSPQNLSMFCAMESRWYCLALPAEPMSENSSIYLSCSQGATPNREMLQTWFCIG